MLILVIKVYFDYDKIDFVEEDVLKQYLKNLADAKVRDMKLTNGNEHDEHKSWYRASVSAWFLLQLFGMYLINFTNCGNPLHHRGQVDKLRLYSDRMGVFCTMSVRKRVIQNNYTGGWTYD